jgi:hypothetical protein
MLNASRLGRFLLVFEEAPRAGVILRERSCVALPARWAPCCALQLLFDIMKPILARVSAMFCQCARPLDDYRSQDQERDEVTAPTRESASEGSLLRRRRAPPLAVFP